MHFSYDKNRAWAENMAIVMQLGLTMAGCIFACFFAGRWLDGYFDAKGLFTILLSIFGIAGGAVVAYRQIMETIGHGPGNDNRPDSPVG